MLLQNRANFEHREVYLSSQRLLALFAESRSPQEPKEARISRPRSRKMETAANRHDCYCVGILRLFLFHVSDIVTVATQRFPATRTAILATSCSDGVWPRWCCYCLPVWRTSGTWMFLYGRSLESRCSCSMSFSMTGCCAAIERIEARM